MMCLNERVKTQQQLIKMQTNILARAENETRDNNNNIIHIIKVFLVIGFCFDYITFGTFEIYVYLKSKGIFCDSILEGFGYLSFICSFLFEPACRQLTTIKIKRSQFRSAVSYNVGKKDVSIAHV